MEMKEDTNYQVFARKYRPQFFHEVIGQDPIVQTLQKSLKYGRVAHAYLFSGPHGTGKTTLARLFAKAINCLHLKEGEPCHVCPSCKEIAGGYSLDVLEIDGASHRGVEDIRKLNETIGYAPPPGKYKIYLIDEVHMLTKEAFNALLKSLEEPPSHVKFFFATTEAHLIPQTIISRCQRFHLQRISTESIVKKLQNIAEELKVEVEERALVLIANLSEGGLRDAESLLDELITYNAEKVSEDGVRELFGLADESVFPSFDHAIKTSDFSYAFTLAEHLFSAGKNLTFFLDALTGHFRRHVEKLFRGEGVYRKEALLEILEMLSVVHLEMKQTPSKKTFLEIFLLRIMHVPHKVSLEMLSQRLEALEERLLKREEGENPKDHAKSPFENIEWPLLDKEGTFLQRDNSPVEKPLLDKEASPKEEDSHDRMRQTSKNQPLIDKQGNPSILQGKDSPVEKPLLDKEASPKEESAHDRMRQTSKNQTLLDKEGNPSILQGKNSLVEKPLLDKEASPKEENSHDRMRQTSKNQILLDKEGNPSILQGKTSPVEKPLLDKEGDPSTPQRENPSEMEKSHSTKIESPLLEKNSPKKILDIQEKNRHETLTRFAQVELRGSLKKE